MTRGEFETICSIVKDQSGIKLETGKEELVKARVSTRLRHLKLDTYAQYLDYLQNTSRGKEIPRLIDAISTNVTSFFREPQHFDYLRETIVPKLVSKAGAGRGRLRIWSAGCSSGEEPYSIAIHLCEGLPGLANWDAKILATDISEQILERARRAVYSPANIETVPGQLLSRYFERMRGANADEYQVATKVRGLVSFGIVNLMAAWPMKGPFDIIFCRNVMIYFDRPTQVKLVERYRSLLAPGGTLFIGHSESLGGKTDGFRNVQSTVYEKQG